MILNIPFFNKVTAILTFIDHVLTFSLSQSAFSKKCVAFKENVIKVSF